MRKEELREILNTHLQSLRLILGIGKFLQHLQSNFMVYSGFQESFATTRFNFEVWQLLWKEWKSGKVDVVQHIQC